MSGHLYVGSPLSDCPPLCCGRTAPEVSEEEGSHASRFYRWFLESSKSCLLLLVALPGLIDTLAQLLAWRSLLWLSMMGRRRYLTQSNFLSTTSLAWSLALHLLFCFSQEKPLRWKEINTQTHTNVTTKIILPCLNYISLGRSLCTEKFLIKHYGFKMRVKRDITLDTKCYEVITAK